MKVTFDEEGYLEFLSMSGDLPNSMELPDDNTLNYKYLNCYKLNDEGTGLILDASKVQIVEQNLTAKGKVAELRKRLNATDYKILRHQREDALGVDTYVTDKEYLLLEAERESIARQIREIEEGKSLTTDVASILAEGEAKRKEKDKAKKDKEDKINELPKIKEEVEKLSKDLTVDNIVKAVIKELEKYYDLSSLKTDKKDQEEKPEPKPEPEHNPEDDKNSEENTTPEEPEKPAKPKK